MPRVLGPAVWRQLSIAAGIAVLTAACSSPAASPSGAPASSAAAPSAASGAGIAVELSEWKVAASPASASAGPVSFAVTNKGTTIHEFVVVKTDMKADSLPVVDHKIDESALTPVDEIEDIEVGASPTLDVNLEPGHYVLLCNIETHYEQGMHADFDVQ
jgi:uncharacterized cupredoxin-like copper-binding protein